MTNDLRIPAPSFEATLHTLVDLALEAPEHRTRKRYIDEQGLPEDLVGHALARLDAPIHIAAAGHSPHHDMRKQALGVLGTPYAQVRFPLLWNRLFTGVDLDGAPIPYDHRFTMFWGMRDKLSVAEDYLVYALLDHIVSPQGRGKALDLPWREDLVRGIKSFRRFLNSEHSGFLVQVQVPDGRGGTLGASQANKDLRQYVDTLTAQAVADLTK
ncbi:hypothetical protein SEA_BAJUNIPER_25 [Microbacterium phage BAjuniper]|nr:hypothetical protein SEA_BAJUNIPER_25 [Microbacterium phage BAjuniper]